MLGKMWKSNKALLVLLVSIVVLGTVILTNFVSFYSVENLVENQLAAHQRTKTEHAAHQIEQHIHGVREKLVTLSKSPRIEGLDSTCSAGSDDVPLIQANSEGDIVACSSQEVSDYLGLNIKNKDYFRIPKETQEPYISGSIRQGSSTQVVVSTPLFETSEYTPYPNFVGKFEGVLLSIVDLEDLYLLYIHPIVGINSDYVLVDMLTNDIIISSGVTKYPDVKDLTIFESSEYGRVIAASMDIVLGISRWKLIIFTPVSSVNQPLKSVQQRHLFSLFFVVIVIVIVMIIMLNLYKRKEELQEQLDKTKVTLGKLGIRAGVEEGAFNTSDTELEPHNVYLLKDDKDQAYELFIGSLTKGFAGFGIVREDPRKLRKKYNLQKTSFIWMTKNPVGEIPSETNINSLMGLIKEFVEKNRSVILLDRLDYVFHENDPNEVIRALHSLTDLVEAHDCIVILSMDSGSVKEDYVKAIESETTDIHRKSELTDAEMGMLQFINDKNIQNKLVSYKDITTEFKITKPTTRVKVNKLRQMGFVQVEQKGRFKSIRITSAGRGLIH